MATTPAIPLPISLPTTAAVHGPYEDLFITAFTIIGKAMDGMSPEQRVTVWQGWIDFWKPLIDLLNGKKP